MKPKIAKLVRQLENLGWVLVRYKKHLVFNKNKDTLIISGTPSDYRSEYNTIQRIKRKEKQHATTS